MVVTSRKNADLNNICVTIDGSQVQRVTQFKNLGVIIDSHLNMKPHIDCICKKVAKKIGYLARISRELPIQHRILLYKSIIAPHFEL